MNARNSITLCAALCLSLFGCEKSDQPASQDAQTADSTSATPAGDAGTTGPTDTLTNLKNQAADKAESAMNTIKEESKQAMETLKETSADAMQAVKEGSQEALQAAKETSKQALDAAREANPLKNTDLNIPGVTRSSNPREGLALGKQAYVQGFCAKCHGPKADGTERAPDLTDDEWLHCDGSVEGIRKVLVSGVPRAQMKDKNRRHAMNPATNLIKDEKMIDALAAYVHSLSQE